MVRKSRESPGPASFWLEQGGQQQRRNEDGEGIGSEDPEFKYGM